MNQAAYSFSKTDIMMPFRRLLKKGSQFEWTTELDDALRAAKVEIVKEIRKGVRIFDKGRTTCLATDWSKSGIGAWLLQKHCECKIIQPFCCPTGWQVTLFASRHLTETESRYAPVEGEALAVVFGLDKCKHFVLGCSDLIIAVDHKPLIGLFTRRGLQDIPNGRLRNLKEKTMPYRFKIIHVDGVKNRVADCLSRHPSDPAVHLNLIDDQPDPKHHVAAIGESPPPSAITFDIIAKHTMSDPQCRNLMNLIENGFPERLENIPQELRQYYKHKEHLACNKGVLTYNN